MTAPTTTTMVVSTDEYDKKENLVPSGRVSSIYETHAQASTEGAPSVRIVALAAGLGLVAGSIMLWTRWIIGHRFSFFELGVSTTAVVVGGLSIVFEGNLPFLREARGAIVGKAPTLGKVRSRGAMYAAAGLLQCAAFRALHLAVGLFATVVGIYMMSVGQRASDSLAVLKKSITDEKELLAAFQANDTNGDGVLETFEFEGLILSLGIELDSDELDAAFESIDTNNDKKIVFDEFRTWWKTFTADAEGVIV